MMNQMIYLFILYIYLPDFCGVLSLTSDEITKLPGLSHKINFKQYSGYLNASKGRHYFYWFVESQSNPKDDPLILWLNGGPGCSSMRGFLTENGPFRVNSEGTTLTEGPHSWNTIANVLFLESPAGTGFSFDEKKIYVNNDNQTAEDNYLALQSFFTKFPHLKNNSFYITGESYAGVYIPTLALEIFRRKSSINLKGVAIGNGVLDVKLLLNSKVAFAVSHGLISNDLVKQWTRDCCHCQSVSQNVCDFDQKDNENCNPFKQLFKYIIDNDINPYNIYDDCPHPNFTYAHKYSHYNKEVSNIFGLNIDSDDQYEEYSIEGQNCVNFGYNKYLNSQSVRKALNIGEGFKEKWIECKEINYTDRSDALSVGTSMRQNVIELISKYKIQTFIVYNGDLDFVCDFIGNQQFVDELGFKLIEKYRKWTVNGLTAGFVKRYEGISFITVRGAGHMVPSDKPEAALKIVKELIGISKVG